MKILQCISDYIDRMSFAVKSIRFFAMAGGLVLIVTGQYLRGSNVEWQASISDTLFWVGLSILLITNLLLVFIDKQPVEILKYLHEEEKRSNELRGVVDDLHFENKALIAWNTLTRLNSGLLGQALANPTMDPASRSSVFEVAVEFIADRKQRLFGIEDDYLNISVYEYSDTDKELHCIACYRSRPSDMKKPHRSWKIGEGHVGNTFKKKRELICADATDPNVADWIEAPSEKWESGDEKKYISLIAVPIAVDVDHPLGVIIVTSDRPQRFVHRSDVETESKGHHPAVEALQDVASQLAQLMCILKVEKIDNGKEEGNE